MKTLFRLLALALLAVLGSGCAALSVKPWERDLLSRPTMRLDGLAREFRGFAATMIHGAMRAPPDPEPWRDVMEPPDPGAAGRRRRAGRLTRCGPSL